ncbi:fluoride efflux transporter FluC [Lapidilactobacillus gannanensis]|uniref:Fluoride-specific ion channel FluC n=1 Tax=Lapidilactobacillus gannanensis TaxID=2486002 RepID=A0ABW4BIW7_9LACO|nr:CrcB family protein [Lapidilactobacillus gannanensis]
MTSLAIAVCAFGGGVLRLAISQWLPTPWATLMINLLGAFLLPLWNGFFGPKILRDRRWAILGLGTGFFGALTTFSSFCLDIIKLLNQQRVSLAIIYLVISMFGGLILAWLGITLSQYLADRELVA